MLIATFVGVVMLPLIYGGLYLYAFWDPYGKLENLPVAIVNEDQCAYKSDKSDKKQYCFGQELIDKLKDDNSMNWQFVDEETAANGLKNKKYYTMATIPKDFSEKILSVDTNNPQQAQIEFESRQASNFMAFKFTDTAFAKIKSTLNEKISKEYFNNIFSETRDSVQDLKTAADGASDLTDGILKAKNGSSDLYDGIDKANSGAVDLKNGLNTLHNGSETLATGASTAMTGTNTLIAGATTLNAGLSNLSAGVNYAATSSASLSAGQGAVVQYLNAYLAANPSAATSVEFMTALGYASKVNDGITQLKAGLDTANAGTQQLTAGSSTLKDGLTSLSVGVSNIATGSASLRDGLSSAINGGTTLVDGLATIKGHQKDLTNGLADAYDGSKELSDKLNESVDKNISKTNESKNTIQAEVMSAPVNIHDMSIDIVNNNGTGFAPYFIPLALWVGGMAIFFLIELTFGKKNIIKEFLDKFSVSLLISTIQALTLDWVMFKFLGLKVNYLWQFVGFNILLAGCFTLIQLFLTLAFGLPGKFIGIVLLMLQLTSNSGSYPIETAPVFFQKVSSYLPMTYAVSGLRELISGDNLALVMTNTRVILTITLVVLVLIFAYLIVMIKKPWAYLKTKKKK